MFRILMTQALFGGERTIHVGLDIGAPVSTPVYAFDDGKIHSFTDNDEDGSYGPTIVTEHQILIEGVEQTIWVLHGHLSRASLEVAGIIAKRQTITKLEIDKIRGVDSTGVINVLLERDIIKVSGEKNAPGKPYLYKTTDFFLEVFSLNDISEIPDIDEFNDYDASET